MWSAVEGNDGVYHVYAISADGTGARTLASNARGPQIVWPWVVYDSKPTTPEQQDQLARLNLVTNQTESIVGPVSVNYFAYDGTGLAWIPESNDDILFEDPVGSAPLHISSGRFLQFVGLNNRLIGWGQDSGAFVYDRKLRVIVQLSNLSDFYPVISDQAVDWVFQPNPNASNPYSGTVTKMLDLRDLP